MFRVNVRISYFILCLLTVSTLSWGQTVVNPSFEDDPWVAPLGTLDLGTVNTLTGWSVIPVSPYPWGLQNANGYDEHGDGVPAGPTPYGAQWVIVGHYGEGGSAIYQTVSGFTPGLAYVLDFALASEFNNAGVGALVEVSFPSGSSTPSEDFEAPLRNHTYWDVWDNYQKVFVADNTDVTIQFLGLAGLSGYDAGIDNVSVTLLVIPVVVDIKPGSCPNPFNHKSKGVVPVAVVGTPDFDPTTEVVPESVTLEGVPVLKWEILDSTQPGDYDPADCYDCFNAEDYLNCDLDGDGFNDAYCGDGIPDLVLYFDTQELAAAIGEAAKGECLELSLSGILGDGATIAGSDSIVILKNID